MQNIIFKNGNNFLLLAPFLRIDSRCWTHTSTMNSTLNKDENNNGDGNSTNGNSEMANTFTRDEISALKRELDKKEEKIWQLEASVKIEKEMGDRFEELLKSEQERYLDTTRELETVQKKEAIRTQQLAKSQGRVQQLQALNKTLEQKDGRTEMIKEKDKAINEAKNIIEEMRRQLESQNMELSESKKAFEEEKGVSAAQRQLIADKDQELQKQHNLIEEKQHQIEFLENEAKLRAEEVAEILNKKNVELEEQLSVILEKERKIAELVKIAKELKLICEKTEKDMETEIAVATRKQQEMTERLQHQNGQMETVKNKLQEKENNLRELKEEMKTLESAALAKEMETKNLMQNLKEQEKTLTQKLKEQMSGELEKFLEGHRSRTGELEGRVRAKELECEDLKKELDTRDSIIESQLDKLEFLQKSLFERESSVERVNEEMMELQNARNEGINRLKQLEDEKQDISLQLQEELRRERQSSERFINELRTDIRDLENKLDEEKQSAVRAMKGTEIREREMLLEKGTLIERLEEFQTQFESEKKLYQEEKQKLATLESQAMEMEKTLKNELGCIEDQCHRLNNENRRLQIQIEQIERLQKELENKNEMLFTAESKLEELMKEREIEKNEMKGVIEERNLLVEGLRQELSEIKARLEDECLQRESARVQTENLGEIGIPSDIKDLTRMAIEQVKRDIETEYNAEETLRELTENIECSPCVSDGDSEGTGESNISSKQTFWIILRVPLIMLTLSLICFFLRAQVHIAVTTMIVIPVAYGFVKGVTKLSDISSLQDYLQNEKIRLFNFKKSVKQLIDRLAVERSLTDCLAKTVENLEVEARESERKELEILREKKTNIERELKEREHLIDRLQLEAQLDRKKQTELEEITKMHEGDSKQVQHMQSVIDKLELVLTERNTNQSVDFYQYEELKIAIDTMREERKNQKLPGEGHGKPLSKKNVEDVNGPGLKIKAVILAIVISSTVMLIFSVQSSSIRCAVFSCMTIVLCAAICNFFIWRQVKRYESRLDYEARTVQERMREIEELTDLLDQDHDVIVKQREAINALEIRLKLKHEKSINKNPKIDQRATKLRTAEGSYNTRENCNNDVEIQTILDRPRKLQRQVSELNEEQLEVVNGLKHAATDIMSLSATKQQLSRAKSDQANGIPLTNSTLDWKSTTFVSICSIIAAVLAFFKLYKISVAMAFLVLGFIFPVAYQYLKNKLKSVKKHKPTKAIHQKKNDSSTTNGMKQTLYDVLFTATVMVAELCIKLPRNLLSGVLSFCVLIASVAYRRMLCNQIITKDKLVEELTNEIKERRQLCDNYCEEIETVKNLLALERSYSKREEKRNESGSELKVNEHRKLVDLRNEANSLKTKSEDRENILKIQEKSRSYLAEIEKLRKQLECTANDEKVKVAQLHMQNQRQQIKIENLQRKLVDATNSKRTETVGKIHTQTLQEQRKLHQLEIEKLQKELKESLRNRGNAEFQQLKAEVAKQKNKVKEMKFDLENEKERNRVLDQEIVEKRQRSEDHRLLKTKERKRTNGTVRRFSGEGKGLEVVAEEIHNVEETGNKLLLNNCFHCHYYYCYYYYHRYHHYYYCYY